MIVSLTKIYFISDLKKKKTPIVYQNITQYNNGQQTQPWQCHQVIYIVHLTLGRKERPLSYQNVTQYQNKQKHSHDRVTR